jgi:hypothetical protein
LQDEAKPGGGATAAHLAVRSTDSLLLCFIGDSEHRAVSFRNGIMAYILTSCKEYLTENV